MTYEGNVYEVTAQYIVNVRIDIGQGFTIDCQNDKKNNSQFLKIAKTLQPNDLVSAKGEPTMVTQSYSSGYYHELRLENCQIELVKKSP